MKYACPKCLREITPPAGGRALHLEDGSPCCVRLTEAEAFEAATGLWDKEMANVRDLLILQARMLVMMSGFLRIASFGHKGEERVVLGELAQRLAHAADVLTAFLERKTACDG